MKKTTWRDIQAEGWFSSFLPMVRTDEEPVGFHGAFIEDVARFFILRHTQPGDFCWDPMSGSGTTLKVAEGAGREVLATDLTPTKPCIEQADARSITILKVNGRPKVTARGSDLSTELFLFDLVILHPPYGATLQFSDNTGDLSNAPTLDDFIDGLYSVLGNVNAHLKPGGYLGLVMGDIWSDKGKGLIPLGFLAMDMAMSLIDGARLKSITIKDIKSNRGARHNKHLWMSRFFRWGAVEMKHEYLFSIQKGK